jgi:hypothetical protein
LLVVSDQAKSVSCKHCNGRVICERIEVKDFVAVRKFRTANVMHIKRKGRVHASVWAEELLIEGSLLGEGTALGAIRLSRKAQVTGPLRATSLEVEPGATIVGEMRIGPEHVPERETLSQALPGEVMDEMEARFGRPGS